MNTVHQTKRKTKLLNRGYTLNRKAIYIVKFTSYNLLHLKGSMVLKELVQSFPSQSFEYTASESPGSLWSDRYRHCNRQPIP